MIEILILILIANASPVFSSFVCSHKPTRPIDNGLRLSDHQYVFGETKTWRGLIAAIVLTGIFSLILTSHIINGVLIALLAMAGDLFSSFIKRRLKKPSSSRTLFLDQIPESLLPALMMMGIYSLSLIQVIEVVTAFFIIELSLSFIFFRLGVRKKPY